MPVVFGPSDETASLIGLILSLTLLNGPMNTSRNNCRKHNPPCHLQMQTKALSCKKEAICEHGPEAPSCPVGKGSFAMDLFQSGNVFYGQINPNLTFLLKITDAVSSGLKRRETFQCVISGQFKSQHLWWCEGAKVHTVWAACMFWKALWMLKCVNICFRATYVPLHTTFILRYYA